MIYLAMDTSGKTASVAVAEDGVLLGARMLYTARAHSQILLPMAKQTLAETGHTVQDVDCFAVANGPGSYTGLRIGIAAVQAMAYATQRDCVGISTLEGLAWNACTVRGRICAAMVARQDLLYTALFESDGETVRRCTEDVVQPAEHCAAMLLQDAQPVMLVGDGAERLHALCTAQKGHPLMQLAPMTQRLQSATGICLAAMHTATQTPAELCVRYLQAVKIG